MSNSALRLQSFVMLTLCSLGSGILGLILPPLFPHLFTHLLVMNTALGLGKSPSPGWENFRKYMASTHDLAVGRMLSRGRKSMTKSEIDNYDLPFYGSGSHDGRAKAGVRRFPVSESD